MLGTETANDLAAAIATGLARLNDLPFVLSEPEAAAQINEVGDPNIVTRFLAWIDQTQGGNAEADILDPGLPLEQQGSELCVDQGPEPLF